MYVILSVHVHEPNGITYVDRWDHIREAKADDARKCLGKPCSPIGATEFYSNMWHVGNGKR